MQSYRGLPGLVDQFTAGRDGSFNGEELLAVQQLGLHVISFEQISTSQEHQDNVPG
jgi:hypothetical protein